MKKIVVCGGAGFVGQNLVPLLKKDYSVVVIDKHKENLNLLKKLNSEVEVILADLSKEGKWQDSFKGADSIIQLNAQIASTKKLPFIKNNVTATKLILNAMKKHKIKYIVHTSSAAVNSVRLDDYAETKKKGEELLTKQKSINYSVLRPSMMYGLFDNKNVGWLISFMKKTPAFPIPGSGKYFRQPVYAEDYAKILIYLAKNKPKNRVYNINGDKITFIDMVRQIRKSRKLKRPLVKLPIPIFITGVKTYNFILNKVEFTPDQVKSLTSGEVFEDFPWWKEFGIKKTSFLSGLEKMSKSQRRDLMLKR